MPGEVTERNLYATVQRQPVCPFAAGPGPDGLPFTDTNVIFAGWPDGPHPGRPGPARRPADPAGSLARTGDPGHRGGGREHGHADERRESTDQGGGSTGREGESTGQRHGSADQGPQVTGWRGRTAGIADPGTADLRGGGQPEGRRTRQSEGAADQKAPGQKALDQKAPGPEGTGPARAADP